MGIYTTTVAYTMISMAEKFQEFFYGYDNDVTFSYKDEAGVIKETTVPNIAKVTRILGETAISHDELNTELQKYNTKTEDTIIINNIIEKFNSYYNKTQVDTLVENTSSKLFHFKDNGNTNAIALNSSSDIYKITTLRNNALFIFTGTKLNTGNVTAKIDDLPIKTVIFKGGNVPAGFIVPDGTYMLTYNSEEDYFNIIMLSNGEEKPEFAFREVHLRDQSGKHTFNFNYGETDKVSVYYNGKLLTDIPGDADYILNGDNTLTLTNDDGSPRPVVSNDDILVFRAWLDIKTIDVLSSGDYDILEKQTNDLRDDIFGDTAILDMGIL